MTQRACPKLLFFSGGTALNSIGAIFKVFVDSAYVLPVSDNGGSSREVMRVLGGPSIGDTRSRIVRLADDSSVEARAVQALLAYRLHVSPAKSKEEWLSILEGLHPLWRDISEAYKETIRAFLVHFNTEVLRRASKHFDWSNGSIGNFFLTGARMFFLSLEAALFWFARVSRTPERARVVPILNTDSAVNIGAELMDGTHIQGQNEISHPPLNTSYGGTFVDKNGLHVPLASRIKRLYYLNEDRQMILPDCNPSVLLKLEEQDSILYSLGSLWTSIVPCLILQGIGERIAAKSGKKVLMLNGYPDRETFGLTATDFILTIAQALNRWDVLHFAPSAYITHLIYLEGSMIPVDILEIEAMGIACIRTQQSPGSSPEKPLYDEKLVVDLFAYLFTQ